MTDFLALACVLLALPGLLLARSGPVPVRFLTLAALVVLLVAALDLEQVMRQQAPARVAVLGTGDDVSADQLRRELTSSGVAVVASGNAPWPERLVRGALVAGPRTAELVVVWSGPLPAQAPGITGRGITALIPDTALDLDPEQLQVWPVGAFEAMRPAGLEVRLADSPRTLVTEVSVTDPDGQEILRETVRLGPEATVANLPLVATRSGEHTVHLAAQVDGVEVQRWGTFAVAPAHPVLVVGAAAQQLAGALEVQGMEVAARSGLPEDLEDWSVLILLDPLSADEQLLLGTYLDGGGGLFVVGGEDGALPQRGEPLHEFLPVFHLDREVLNNEDRGDAPAAEKELPEDEEPPEEETEPPPPPPDPPAGEIEDAELDPIEEEVDRRLVGMVLVVDRSLSMGTLVEGGNQIRMDYAKRAALATAEALQEGDQLGVVTFGNKGFGRTELPMTQVTDWQTIQTRVSRLSHHRESTFLSSGLERAGELLEPSQLAVRFVVVVTDGIFQDDLLATSRARRLAAQGISVSLIRIGGSEGGVTQSKQLAEAGGGSYSQPRNAREVPRLVVVEVGRALGRAGRELPDVADLNDPAADPDPPPPPDVVETPPPPEEKPPEPDEPEAEAEARLRVRAVADSVLLEPRPAGGFPDLGGMDAVTGRPDAHVLLVGGEEGLPLLAFANRGLGRIGVWAADLTGAWGAAWREDPFFPGRLATWVQSLFPPREELPRDLFQKSSVWPPVPTPAELEKLNRIAATVRRIGDYQAPGSRTALTSRSLAQDFAIAGALALVLLAFGEFLLLRWHGGTRP